MGNKTGISRKMVFVAVTAGMLVLTLAAGVASAQQGTEVQEDRPPGAIVGTRGDDTLVGTERPDYFDALREDDTLLGRESGDMLRAGEGDDLAVGGGGDDYFVGDKPGVGVGPDGIAVVCC